MSKLCFGCMSHYSDEYTICPYCGYEEGTPRQNTMHLEPGTILHARYMLGKVLGYGGFGVTYLAWDLISDTKAAIKEYLPNGLAARQPDETQVQVYSAKNEGIYKGGLERFMKEARQLKQFREVYGIVKIHDCFAENGTAYLVMEYLDGETLGEKLKREKKITPEEAAEIVLPLTKALETVHGSGIIHRDISPDNIYLTKDGKVYLIDFGSARYDTSSGNNNFTVMIKHGYSPIEQYQSNSSQGSYTDVYALAATMYRAITGVIPPNSIERLSVRKTDGTDTLEPVRKLCPEASEKLEEVLAKALSLDQSERTQTMERFEAELRAAFGAEETIEPEDIPKEQPHKTNKAGILVGILSAFVVVLGIAVAVVMLQYVTVPDVTNMDQETAMAVLEERGLTGTAVYRYSAEIPLNQAIGTDLEAGSRIKKGTELQLYLSTGPKGFQLNGKVIGSKVGWENNPDVGAKAAFDGDPETYFDPADMGVGYCGVKMKQKYILTEVSVMSRKDWESRLIGAVIQGSNDGRNWTILYVYHVPGEHGRYISQSNFINNTGYTMFRYYNEVNHGDVAEVQFYGYPAE